MPTRCILLMLLFGECAPEVYFDMLDSLCCLFLHGLDCLWLHLCQVWHNPSQLPVWTACPKSSAIQKGWKCSAWGQVLSGFVAIQSLLSQWFCRSIQYVLDWRLFCFFGDLCFTFIHLFIYLFQGAWCFPSNPRSCIFICMVNRWPENSNTP